MSDTNALLAHILSGSPFVLSTDEQRRVAAWNKALPIPGRPAHLERFDPCNFRVLHWVAYGTDSEYGWDIDHIVPLALGGTEDLSNLRARHFSENRAAGARLGNHLADASAGRPLRNRPADAAAKEPFTYLAASSGQTS